MSAFTMDTDDLVINENIPVKQFEHQQKQIETHSSQQIYADECIEWMGGYLKKKKLRTYGRKRITMRNHSNKIIMNKVTTAHRVSLCCHLKDINFMTRKLQVSHLCHNKKCVFVKHLVSESQSDNRKRSKCAKKKKCFCKHAVSCIFPAPPPKDPCIYCTQNVNNEDQALDCDGCKKWQHINCDDIMTMEEYTTLNEENGVKEWKCFKCST